MRSFCPTGKLERFTIVFIHKKNCSILLSLIYHSFLDHLIIIISLFVKYCIINRVENIQMLFIIIKNASAKCAVVFNNM